jgi:hypothetical protein
MKVELITIKSGSNQSISESINEKLNKLFKDGYTVKDIEYLYTLNGLKIFMVKMV